MHQLFTRHRRPLDTTQRIIINEKNHHTNRKLSCIFDWIGAQLSDVGKAPIEAAQKRKNALEKYISVADPDEFGVTPFFLTGTELALALTSKKLFEIFSWLYS